MMIALPITNFLEAWTAIIAILCAAIGILNMSLGWRDGVVELKYAEEGVPERGFGADHSTPQNNPSPPKQGMQPVPQASPGPALQTPQMNPPAAPPQGPPPAPAGPPGGKRDVVMNDPFMEDVEL